MQKRLDHIDVAKGLGILLVALGHNRALVDNIPALHVVIYLFHMPLFFFLSGITTPTTLDVPQLKKRLIGLLKPYVAGIVLFLPRQLSFPDHPSNTDSLLKMFWGSGNGLYNTPIWFLMALVSGYLAYAFVQHIRQRFGQASGFPVIALAMLGVTYWMMTMQIGFPLLPKDEAGRPLGAIWNLDLAPLVASFLLLGNWWRVHHGTTERFASGPMALAVVASIGLFAALTAFDPAADLNYRVVQAGWAAALCGLAGIFFSVYGATLVSRHVAPAKVFLAFLGRNTLIILIFHAAIQSLAVRVLYHRLSLGSIELAAISFVVCMGLAALSQYVVNRFTLLKKVFYAN
jgi:fucose 4-O-acetylase-like acetyltransferase